MTAIKELKMMKIDFKRIFLFIFLLIIVPAVFFIVGWAGHAIFIERTNLNIAPADRIHTKDITWKNNSLCIKINNPQMSIGIGSSMLPAFSEQTNIVEIEIKNETDIHVGDVVEYWSPEINNYILHRVVEINEDEFGRYYTTRGDNNYEKDPGKIRFSQLRKVVVAVIY